MTGATGFLGSHLLRKLLNNQNQVIILKRSFSDTRRIDELINHAISYNIDTTPLDIIFEKHRVDAVIHTATSYGRNGEKASQVLASNLLYPVELLELSIESRVGVFINTDTFTNDMQYPPEGLEYYTFSKSFFTDYARQMLKNIQFRFINLRLEHIYGENDNNTKFLPFIIKSFLGNKDKLDLTPGEQERDFIYVDDVVSAYITLIDNHLKIENTMTSYEVGTGVPVTLKDFVVLVKNACKSNTDIKFGALSYRKNEVMSSKANIIKLQELGWSPLTKLEDGIDKVVEYYKSSIDL